MTLGKGAKVKSDNLFVDLVSIMTTGWGNQSHVIKDISLLPEEKQANNQLSNAQRRQTNKQGSS